MYITFEYDIRVCVLCVLCVNVCVYHLPVVCVSFVYDLCVCVCVYVYIYMCVCVCVCACV